MQPPRQPGRLFVYGRLQMEMIFVLLWHTKGSTA